MSRCAAPGARQARRRSAANCCGAGVARRALRALVFAALAALASGRDKMHRGKHEAASRRDRRAAFGETLEQATGGMCHYMEESPFQEFFDTDLNISRWDWRSMDGLFHCNRGTDEYCTMASRSNFMMQQVLPFYPSPVNVSGAILLLSQDPCNNPYKRNACCQPSRKTFGGYSCANWTGAHLVSRGCILYGRLTVEMAMRMPRGTQAFWDAGTYIYGGSPDPTWNELDMIFRTQLTSAAAVNASAPANATFVSNTFDATFFNPIEHKQTFSYSSFPRFTGYMAREYHNYSVLWAPHYVTWYMDDTVYLNQTRRNGFHRRFGLHGETLIPWRPMTIRLILHTADGTLAPQPDVHIYVRRVAYEPLPASDYGVPLWRRLYQLMQDAFLVVLVVSLAYVCLACCGDGSLVPRFADGDDDRRARRGAAAFVSEGEGARRVGLGPAGVDMEAFSRRAEARARIAAERKAERAAEEAAKAEAEAERVPLLAAQQQQQQQRDNAPPASTADVARAAAAAGQAAVAAAKAQSSEAVLRSRPAPQQAWRPPPQPQQQQQQPAPQAPWRPPPQEARQPPLARVAPREPVPSFVVSEGPGSPQSPQSPTSPTSPTSPPSPGSVPSRPLPRGFGRAPLPAEMAPVALQPMPGSAPPPSRPRPAAAAPPAESPEPVAPTYPAPPPRPRAQTPPGGWAAPPRPQLLAGAGFAGSPPAAAASFGAGAAPHAAAGMPQGRRARPRPQYGAQPPPGAGDGL